MAKSNKVSLIIKRLNESVKSPNSDRRVNLGSSFALTVYFLKLLVIN